MTDRFRFFSTVAELKAYAENPPYNETLEAREELCVGLEFQDRNPNDILQHRYSYTIYVDQLRLPQSTESLVDPYAW